MKKYYRFVSFAIYKYSYNNISITFDLKNVRYRNDDIKLYGYNDGQTSLYI